MQKEKSKTSGKRSSGKRSGTSPALKQSLELPPAVKRPKRRMEELEIIPPRERGFFRAEDGTPLFYEVRGEGRPLLLCYGLTCRREHWRHQVAHFTKNYQ